MDKVLKREIRQLWRNRLLLGIGSLALIVCSIWQLQDVLKYRPPQHRWSLDLFKALELLTDKNSSAEVRELAASEIQTIAQAQSLSLTATQAKDLAEDLVKEDQTRAWALNARSLRQDLELTEELDRTQALTKDLAVVVAQDLDLAEELAEKLAWAMDVNLILAEDLDLAKDLAVADRLAKNLSVAASKVGGKAEDLALFVAEELTRVREDFLVAILIAELESIYGLTVYRGETLDFHLSNEPSRARNLLHSVVLLGLSVVMLMTLLVLLLRLQDRSSLPATSHLIAFLPEEYVAEFSVLQERMKKAKASPWQVRIRLFEEFVTLLWVFYIQVQFENLFLPSDDRKIDDD